MKKFLLVAVLVIGAILMCLTGITVLGILYVTTAEDLTVTEADRELLVLAEELEYYFDDYTAVAAYAEFEKLEYVDGSVELSYTYDNDDDDQPFISVTINKESTVKEARESVPIMWNMMKLGMNMAESEIEIANEGSLGIGDASKYGYVRYQEELVGNMLVIRKGKCVYLFVIMGFYFDDWDLVKEIIQEKIDLLDGWN